MSDDCEVVISGMSGQFPLCENIPEFREKLFANENLITTTDQKWPSTYNYKFGDPKIPHATGKYLRDDVFDEGIFHMNTQVTRVLDSLNRMILERAYEAVLDAGLNPRELNGLNGATYASLTDSEFDIIVLDSYLTYSYILGLSKNFLANRISFAFNLTGPSCVLFTSWEGGMTQLALACRHIRDGGDCAFVAVSSNFFIPEFSLHSVNANLLSEDGLCKAFDENADGYGKSEATVVLFLQRADTAKRIYATVVFADAITDSAHNNMLLNLGEDDIERVLRKMYEKNKNRVKPENVAFMELEAPGLKHLDRNELNAVSKVMCNDRRSEPLLVGSVKSNAGHTEAASSLVSLVKAVIALETDRIPANINFSKPNAGIEALKDGKVKVVTENSNLPGPLVAVNSVGLGGVIGHVVLKQNPKVVAENEKSENLPRLIVFQGRTEEGLRENIKKAHSMPFDKNWISMVNDVFLTPMNTHKFRAYTVLPFTEKAASHVTEVPLMRKPIWFIFSGMGSQWTGMGEGLLKIPVFAEAIAKCDSVLKPKGLDIYEIITTKDESIFDNILHSFVGIASIQVGLVDILKTLGIVPDGLLGHSVGETACSYADGCLTLEQTVLSAYARGAASNDAKTIKGMMAAVGKGYEQMAPLLPPGIEIACRNSSESCTLSGPTAIVEKFVNELKSQGIFAKAVNVSNIAYHSKYIASAGPYLLKNLKLVIPNPKKRSTKWVSTSVPECNWGSELSFFCSAEYHTNNLLSPVLFEEGCKHIPKNAVVVEIAPHGLLQPILKKSLPGERVNISLTHRNYFGDDAVYFLLSAIGGMFTNGHQPNVNKLFPQISYPVPRNTPSIAPYVTFDHNRKIAPFDYLKKKPHYLSREYIKVELHQGSPYKYLAGHKIQNECVIPGSFHLYLVWYVLSIMKNERIGESGIIFENVVLHKSLSISIKNWREFRVLITKGTGSFEVMLESEDEKICPQLMASGTVRLAVESDNFNSFDIGSEYHEQRDNKMETFGMEEFYDAYEEKGFDLKSPFRTISILERNESNLFGKVTWNGNWVAFLDSLSKVFVFPEVKNNANILVPRRIRRLAIPCDKFRTLKDGDSLEFYKSISTQQLFCNGLEITGIRTVSLKSEGFFDRSNRLGVRGLQFVPHFNPALSITDFLQLCLQIASECAAFQRKTLFIRDSSSGELFDRVKASVKKDASIKDIVIFSDSKNDLDEGNCTLIVADDLKKLKELPAVVAAAAAVTGENGNIFALSYSNFEEIEGFAAVCKNEELIFLKKVAVNLNEIHIADENDNIISDEIEGGNSNKLMVKRKILPEDISLLVSNRNPFKNRFVFILDTDAPKFSPEIPIYKREISLNLPSAVLNNGQWGSYRSFDIDEESERSDDKKAKVVTLHNSKLEVNTTGKCEYREESAVMEYSGVSEDGEKVAGIATFRKGSEAISDPLLTWQVPHEWDLEEASKVPVAYALACYILFALPIFPTNTIFLNARETNDFVKACLTLALSAGFHIIVAVPSEKDKLALKTFFPYLKENMILNNGDCDYEVELLRKPRLMVINCQRELKHMNACMNSVAEKGFYVDMTGNSAAEHSFGMYYFFGNRSFRCINDEIFTLLALSKKTKEEISDLMKEFISKGIVRLWSKVKKLDKKSIGNKVAAETGKIVNFKPIRFDGQHSYIIIIGGNREGSEWTELLEWIIRMGARKILLVLDNFASRPKFAKETHKTMGKKSSFVISTFSSRADTVAGAKSLLAEADNLAPLEAVFFVFTREEKKMTNLDEASRKYPGVHFVSLFSGGIAAFEKRRRDGFPAAVFHSSHPIRKLIPVLKQIEMLKKPLASYPLYNLSFGAEFADDKKENITPYLPNDLQSILEIGNTVYPDVDFVEKTSMSPKYADVKGVYPMFIIPAVGEGPLQSVIRNSHYPVFCANQTGEFHPAEIWAARLAAAVERIQPRGPVTIVGETWKSCVALELGQMLREKGRMVKLILLEGGPADWKKSLFALGNPDTYEFDHRLLEELFSFNPLVKSLRLSGTMKWEKALEACLSVTKCPSDNKEGLKAGVNAVRSSLLIVHEYELKKSSMDVFHIKHTAADHLVEELCQKEEIKLLEFEKYEDFLRNPSLSNIVNNEILFKWW